MDSLKSPYTPITQQQPKYAKFDDFLLLMLPNKCLAREIKEDTKD